ncbi:MAG: hypothetical protein ACYC8T_37715, partial [Myxococcaceae bacterium]
AAALAGLVVAALAWRFRPAAHWPVALAAAGAVALAWLALLPAGRHVEWLSARSLSTGVGLVLVGAAGVLARVGSRHRRRAELILSSAPLELDEAVRAVRLGRGRGAGLFRGRLAASDPVASPGGVLGALYQAEVRAVAVNGARRGALLSRERSRSPVVSLRGERTEVSIELGRGEVLGPVRARQCRTGGVVTLLSPRSFAEGQPPADAVSFERVGKVGERCLVAGRLEEGPVPGALRLRGEGGGPVVILGEDPVPFGRAFAWKSWASFAAAAALLAASAACLAGR